MKVIQQKRSCKKFTLPKQTTIIKNTARRAKILLPCLSLVAITLLSGMILSSSLSLAENQQLSASVRVVESCAMTITGADSHFTELVGGMVDQNIGESTISVACNDINGYSIYAVGYGNGTEGNTNLTGTTTGEIIPTGTDIPETSGNPVSQSQWAMRLSAVSSEFVPTIVSDSEGSFASNHKIPSTNTKVATFTNNISLTGFSKISTTYAVGVIPYQAADTYTGQVKYTLVHPNFADSNQKVYMQDLTPTMIADLLPNVGNTFVAYDKRDNQSYKIAKLADGKYWMVENLNLAGGTTITSADSDVTESYTLPASATKNENDNNLTDATQFSDDNTAYVFNSGNKTNCGASGQNVPCGSYYSYVAATAGTGASITSNGYNASGSICPKGWRLPTATTEGVDRDSGGYTGGDFYNLAIQYGMTTGNYKEDPDNSPTFASLAGPGTTPGFLRAGRYYDSTFNYGGSYGFYWSSTSASGTYAYYMNFGSSYVDSADNNTRRRGNSVRCLFETRDITDISTMQEISPAIAANTPVGTSTTLTDSRGGVTKSYTIAKLADNKVWMTSNLDLPGGTTITSNDSDVATNFTLPTSAEKNADNNNLTDSTQFSNDNTAYVFNSGNNTNCGAYGQNIPCGSYYSYLAATAGTGANVTADGYNASGSICPKGWRLPTSTTSNASATSNNNWKTGDFYAIAKAYGANLESNYSQNSSTFYNNAGPNTVPNFLLAGVYDNSIFYNGGSYGNFWSSTSNSGSYAYNLYLNSSSINSASEYYRKIGRSIRCIAKS